MRSWRPWRTAAWCPAPPPGQVSRTGVGRAWGARWRLRRAGVRPSTACLRLARASARTARTASPCTISVLRVVTAPLAAERTAREGTARDAAEPSCLAADCGSVQACQPHLQGEFLCDRGLPGDDGRALSSGSGRRRGASRGCAGTRAEAAPAHGGGSHSAGPAGDRSTRAATTATVPLVRDGTDGSGRRARPLGTAWTTGPDSAARDSQRAPQSQRRDNEGGGDRLQRPTPVLVLIPVTRRKSKSLRRKRSAGCLAGSRPQPLGIPPATQLAVNVSRLSAGAGLGGVSGQLEDQRMPRRFDGSAALRRSRQPVRDQTYQRTPRALYR